MTQSMMDAFVMGSGFGFFIGVWAGAWAFKAGYEWERRHETKETPDAQD